MIRYTKEHKEHNMKKIQPKKFEEFKQKKIPQRNDFGSQTSSLEVLPSISQISVEP